MKTAFLIPALLLVIWGIISMVAMISYCSKKGIKINWLFIRLFFFRYVNDYIKITKEETGKTGFWFYSMVISMNTALVLVIIGWFVG